MTIPVLMKRQNRSGIHFASGQVNGYFDLYDEKHNKPEDWFGLLNNASSPYFDALGRYAHITFPVANLKAVADPVEWINSMTTWYMRNRNYWDW